MFTEAASRGGVCIEKVGSREIPPPLPTVTPTSLEQLELRSLRTIKTQPQADTDMPPSDAPTGQHSKAQGK